MPKFGWVRGLKGPEPQLILDDSVFGVRGEKLHNFIQIRDIDVGEAGLGVSTLASIYPYVEVGDAAS